MENLEISNLKLNTERFRKSFTVKDNKTFVNERIRVVFPKRWLNIGLADISPTSTSVMGIYGILNDSGEFTKIINLIKQNLTPTYIEYVNVQGKDYVLLTFEPNSVYMASNTLVINQKDMYGVFDEFYSNGNIPWYINYEDLGKLFNKSRKYCDTNIGDDTLLYEILASTVSRDPMNKKVLFRLSKAKQPAYVGLNDVRYGYINTGSRLIGGYFKEGITAAIVDQETTESETVKLLRM